MIDRELDTTQQRGLIGLSNLMPTEWRKLDSALHVGANDNPSLEAATSRLKIEVPSNPPTSHSCYTTTASASSWRPPAVPRAPAPASLSPPRPSARARLNATPIAPWPWAPLLAWSAPTPLTTRSPPTIAPRPGSPALLLAWSAPTLATRCPSPTTPALPLPLGPFSDRHFFVVERPCIHWLFFVNALRDGNGLAHDVAYGHRSLVVSRHRGRRHIDIRTARSRAVVLLLVSAHRRICADHAGRHSRGSHWPLTEPSAAGRKLSCTP